MKEKEFDFTKFRIETKIFEKMLVELGITKRSYCEFRDRKPSWFYNVLRKRGYLNHKDIKALFSSGSGVSLSEFVALCEKHCLEVNENVLEILKKEEE